MVGIGIIGYGYWGPNLLRNFHTHPNVKSLAVAEFREERRNHLKINYPSVKVFSDANELIEDSEIDAVVIATPVFTHFDLAIKAIKSGKHVLIEKPMTSSVFEAEVLIELAQKTNVVLMVDHTFLYTGAVHKIKELIQDNVIGQPRYFDSTRINLGLFQPDVNVLWDLAPHDLSILSFLFNEKPISVNATGISHTYNGIENIAYLTVNYEKDFIAHLNCSWTSPVKIRQTLIGGDNRMIVYNDLEPSEKVRVYDTGYSHNSEEDKLNIRVDYRIGDISIPKLSNLEALSLVVSDFLEAILNNKEPISTAKIGLEVVKILEAAQTSIKNKGKEILVK